MGKTDQKENPLAQDFTCGSLLKFAFPTMVTMMFMGIYTIGDTVMASRFVNANALSAINVVTPVVNVIVGLGTMLAAGGSALVARELGCGKVERAKQDFTWIVLFGAVLGLAVALLGTVFLEPLIRGLGASEVLVPYCRDYLLIILWFTPAGMLQVMFQNLIVTAGKPGFGLALSLGAGAINVVLDYFFMVPMELGIAGSALGTGIGYVIPAAVGMVFFSGQNGTLSFTKPVLDFPVLAESCMNGSSEMVSQISSAVTTFFFNLTMMGLLGETGVAAIAILIYSQFFLTTLYIGFSMGVAPVISFRYGVGNDAELKRIVRMCLSCIGVSSAGVWIFCLAGGNWLVRLFTGRQEAVYAAAAAGFRLFRNEFLFSGFNIFASSLFTALSNGKMSAILSFLRTFGFLMVGLLVLPGFLGVDGVWLAVPAAEVLSFMAAAFFVYRLFFDICRK